MSFPYFHGMDGVTGGDGLVCGEGEKRGVFGGHRFGRILGRRWWLRFRKGFWVLVC